MYLPVFLILRLCPQLMLGSPLPPLELPLGSAKSCSFSASLLRVWGVWCVCARTCVCHVMKTVLYFFLSVFFFFFFELFTLYWSVAS